MLSTFFQRVTQKSTERQKAKDTTFESLVRDVADQKPLDPERVADQLDKLNKKPSDLEAAVAMFTQRRDWRKQVDAAAGLEREKETNHQRREAAGKAYEATVEKAKTDYFATVNPLDQRDSEIEAILRTADQARAKLLETSTASGPVPKAEGLRRQAAELRDQAKAKAAEAASIEKGPVPTEHDTGPRGAWIGADQAERMRKEIESRHIAATTPLVVESTRLTKEAVKLEQAADLAEVEAKMAV
jgi:hypothetical protein